MSMSAGVADAVADADAKDDDPSNAEDGKAEGVKSEGAEGDGAELATLPDLPPMPVDADAGHGADADADAAAAADEEDGGDAPAPDADLRGWFLRHALPHDEGVAVVLDGWGVECVEQLKLLPREYFVSIFEGHKFIVKETAKVVFDELRAAPLDIGRCALHAPRRGTAPAASRRGTEDAIARAPEEQERGVAPEPGRGRPAAAGEDVSPPPRPPAPAEPRGPPHAPGGGKRERADQARSLSSAAREWLDEGPPLNVRGKPMTMSEFARTKGIPKATFQEYVLNDMSKRRALRTHDDGKPAVSNENSPGSPKQFTGSKLCEGIIPSRLQFHNYLSLMHKYGKTNPHGVYELREYGDSGTYNLYAKTCTGDGIPRRRKTCAGMRCDACHAEWYNKSSAYKTVVLRRGRKLAEAERVVDRPILSQEDKLNLRKLINTSEACFNEGEGQELRATAKRRLNSTVEREDCRAI